MTALGQACRGAGRRNRRIGDDVSVVGRIDCNGFGLGFAAKGAGEGFYAVRGAGCRRGDGAVIPDVIAHDGFPRLILVQIDVKRPEIAGGIEVELTDFPCEVETVGGMQRIGQAQGGIVVLPCLRFARRRCQIGQVRCGREIAVCIRAVEQGEAAVRRGRRGCRPVKVCKSVVCIGNARHGVADCHAFYRDGNAPHAVVAAVRLRRNGVIRVVIPCDKQVAIARRHGRDAKIPGHGVIHRVALFAAAGADFCRVAALAVCSCHALPIVPQSRNRFGVGVAAFCTGIRLDARRGAGGIRGGFHYIAVTKRRNGFLFDKNSAANGAMTALGHACCGAGCRNRRVKYDGVSRRGNHGCFLFVAACAGAGQLAIRGAGGSREGGVHKRVPQRGNDFLCDKNLATDGAMAALGQACFGAVCRSRRIGNYRVPQSRDGPGLGFAAARAGEGFFAFCGAGRLRSDDAVVKEVSQGDDHRGRGDLRAADGAIGAARSPCRGAGGCNVRIRDRRMTHRRNDGGCGKLFAADGAVGAARLPCRGAGGCNVRIRSRRMPCRRNDGGCGKLCVADGAVCAARSPRRGAGGCHIRISDDRVRRHRDGLRLGDAANGANEGFDAFCRAGGRRGHFAVVPCVNARAGGLLIFEQIHEERAVIACGMEIELPDVLVEIQIRRRLPRVGQVQGRAVVIPSLRRRRRRIRVGQIRARRQIPRTVRVVVQREVVGVCGSGCRRPFQIGIGISACDDACHPVAERNALQPNDHALPPVARIVLIADGGDGVVGALIVCHKDVFLSRGKRIDAVVALGGLIGFFARGAAARTDGDGVVADAVRACLRNPCVPKHRDGFGVGVAAL